MSFRLFLVHLGVALLSCPCLAGATQAGELTAQERLEAVRHELLQAAMQGTTQVRATSWIDAQGALRESSSFRQGLQVRGLKVLAYQRDDAGQPRAKVQWQGAEDLLVPSRPDLPGSAVQAPAHASGVIPAACPPSGLRHVLSWSLETSGHWPVDEAHLVRDAGQRLSRHWQDAAATQPHWRLGQWLATASAVQGAGSSYLRMLTDVAPAPVTSLMAQIQVQEIMGAADGVTLPWRDRPESGPHVSVSIRVTDGAAPEPLFEAAAQLPLLAHRRPWAQPHLQPAVLEQLGRLVHSWARAMDERLRCLPVQVRVTRVQGQRVLVDQGELAGLRVGEEFVLLDHRKVPHQMLEPGASERLVLARVERVARQGAELQVLAGPSAQIAAHWLAWPAQVSSIQASAMPKP